MARGRGSRALARVALAVAGLALLLALASPVLEGPLRRRMEAEVNRKLQGYAVRIPKLDLQLLRLAVDLRGVEIRQVSNPEPPVAVLPRLHASVQWKALLRLRVAADFLFERPAFYVNLPQVRSETSSPVAFRHRGWQDAALAIFPLRINLLTIKSGRLTYIDEDPRRPLELSEIQLEAADIRNVRSAARAYPSPVRFEAVVFDSGHAKAQGHADFLSAPFPGAHVRFSLREIPLEALGPVTQRANLRVRGGALERRASSSTPRVSDSGASPTSPSAAFASTTSRSKPPGQDADAPRTRGPSASRPFDLRVERFRVVQSEVGFENRSTNPPYRLSVDAVNLEITGYRRGSAEPAVAKLEGRFMGNGPLHATLTLPGGSLDGLNFTLLTAIEETDVRRLNGLLRAHAGFDAAQGRFSLYSELRVRNGFVNGYVKPLFQDMKVYDPVQDRRKGLLRKTYEGVVGAMTKIFENSKRDEVATVVPISGQIAKPDSSLLPALGGLIENAFFNAILPGFERQRHARP